MGCDGWEPMRMPGRRDKSLRMRVPALIVLLAVVGAGGCAAIGVGVRKDASGSLGSPDGRAVTPAELDELTRAFADR